MAKTMEFEGHRREIQFLFCFFLVWYDKLVTWLAASLKVACFKILTSFYG